MPYASGKIAELFANPICIVFENIVSRMMSSVASGKRVLANRILCLPVQFQ